MGEKEKDFKNFSLQELEGELQRVKRKGVFRKTLRASLYALIVVAAVTVLVATLWLPVLKIYGSSMTPTLNESNIVFSIKTSSIETGDVIAFYYENKLLVKRCIAGPTDWVDIDEDGTVYVNGTQYTSSTLPNQFMGGGRGSWDSQGGFANQGGWGGQGGGRHH